MESNNRRKSIKKRDKQNISKLYGRNKFTVSGIIKKLTTLTS